MSWMHTVPYIAGAAAFLLLPGLVILRAAGIRGLGTFAFALPASATVIGVSAILANALGVRWSVPVYLVGAAVVALLALLGRFALAIWRTDITTAHSSDTFDTPVVSRLQSFRWGVDTTVALIYGAAVLLPAAALFYRLAHAFGNVENISQTYDAIYHLNAVRAILDGGNGSSLTLGNLTPEARGFYPAVWHDMVALVAQLFGLSVPAGVNITNIVIACLVWPLSLLFFITRITGPRLLPIVLTAALAPAFPAFPYLLLDFGVLYPTFLAVAMLPALLGAALQLFRMTQADFSTVWAGAVSLCAAMPGMVLAHPSALHAFIALLTPVVAARLWWGFRTRSQSPEKAASFRKLIVFAAVYTIVGIALWRFIRPASLWLPTQSPALAAGEILSGTPMGLPGGLIMFLLTVTGIVFLFRVRRQRWAVGMFAVAGWLYMVCSAFPVSKLRTFYTGVWYSDPNRLAALLPIAAAPVVVLGAESVIRWLTKFIMQSSLYTRLAGSRIPALRNRLVVSAALAATLIGAMALNLQSGAVTAEQSRLNASYAIGPSAPLLSSDERALLERLPSHVPADETVLGNPWTGASLVYALSDRKTTKPHISSAVSEDQKFLLGHIDEAAANPAVCETAKASKTFWILDFGTQEVHQGSHPLEGTGQLAGRQGLVLVDRVGQAKLYKLTACS